jgi:hypothetical protein
MLESESSRMKLNESLGKFLEKKKKTLQQKITSQSKQSLCMYWLNRMVGASMR